MGKGSEQRALMTAEEIRKAIHYDPDSGLLTWRWRSDVCPQWNGKHAGRPALNYVDIRGYRTGRFNWCRVSAHRVAWLIYYGKWPDNFIDHINGNKSDNRISNLRETDKRGNGRNQPRRADNTSGCTGVHWAERRKSWVVSLSSRYVKSYRTYEEAVSARKQLEQEHGYHPNHDRVRA